MKAAVYLRVSTDRQEVENQRPDCERLCASRGWDAEVVEEVESGAKRRPEWDRVMELARTGKVNAVVVWSIDRMGRDRVRVAQALRDLWRWGVEVVSMRESWIDQGAGPLRDLLVEIISWCAESERARLIERTRAGIARARAKGTKLGRRRVLPAEVVAALPELARDRTPGLVRRELIRLGLGKWPRSTLRTAIDRMKGVDDGILR